MTLAADRWPTFAGRPELAPSARNGTAVVWRMEMTKLAGQIRVRAVVLLCVTVPFLVVGAFHVQSAVPSDTLFGQWVHSSGFAVPLVVLGFSGQWVLPVLVALVAGDIFSSEDHFGTWKTVLTRSRSRGEIFAGKLLAAVTYSVAVVVVLAVASLAAGAASGTQPLVGLSGQLVPAGQATTLVLASWATQLAPVLAFTAIAVLLSVLARNSVVGTGAPVLIALVLQLLTLVDLPRSLRVVLPDTPFVSWHGFWVQVPFYGPLREGIVTGLVWFVVGAVAAWVVFRRRSIRAA
jgi:ABC-2 type transport system permease protein